MMIKYLIEKEFKQILRNSFLPKMILGMPIIMMLILPWAADLEIKNINLSIVDHDHSSWSDRLTRKITASGYFRLANLSETNEEAMQSIEKHEADIILEIEPGFEKNLIKEGNANVMISANAVNISKGGIGSTYLASILSDFASEIREENNTGLATAASNKLIGITSNYRFNSHLNYKFFIVPAIMVILLTLLCGVLPALNIVGEKEVGTIEQINVTPVNKAVFILAKLIPYWIIGILVLTICILIAGWVYNLIPSGSYFTLFCCVVVYIVTMSGFGLIISNYSATMQQAMFVMFFFMMVFILMSGLFTPVASMPDWAQKIAVFNPLKYFITIMRMIYLKGSTLTDLLPELGALGCFTVVVNSWAILSYRKTL